MTTTTTTTAKPTSSSFRPAALGLLIGCSALMAQTLPKPVDQASDINRWDDRVFDDAKR